ncbi:hypothetical protein [Mycoplasma simbae]|uniref:hypothetical protein n=1 Tax=Mycoplasma simbae TaxID=36744 RepID=UPI000495E792|nr:hypothetical protein [Mycoplasma simbae]
MLITFNRRFLSQNPRAVFTAFRVEDFTNEVKNEKKYNELKELALQVLADKELIDEFKTTLVSKLYKSNSFLDILAKGASAFETSDVLQNVINMLTVLNGYTLSLVPTSDKFGRLDIDFLDGEFVYSNNGVKVAPVYKQNIEKSNAQAKNILFLESVDETDYENYLQSITWTTLWLAKIFGVAPTRKILTIVADTVDVYSTSEIDWTTEGWDQFGEISLIRKSRNATPKCHI